MSSPRYKNEIGNIYGNLTVEEFVKTDKQTSFWKCKCTCGKYKITRGNTLRSGQCKSCGSCDLQKEMSPDAGYKKHYNSTKAGAKSRNLDFLLDFEFFKSIVTQDCFYCGEKPSQIKYAESKRGLDYYVTSICNGVDRVNSDLGYTVDNVVACCFMCNRMKSNFKLNEFLVKVKDIYEHAKKTSIGPENFGD